MRDIKVFTNHPTNLYRLTIDIPDQSRTIVRTSDMLPAVGAFFYVAEKKYIVKDVSKPEVVDTFLTDLYIYDFAVAGMSKRTEISISVGLVQVQLEV